MNEDRSQGGASADPDARAFTGGPDMPPQEPDQPGDRNEELLRKDEGKQAEDKPDAADEGHGDYGGLPGYGG